MPTLSIIIPVYNQARMTEQILKDIPTKMKSDYEVIIVDNGSDNETKELLKNHKDIVLITYPKNRYVTEAWNSGIAIARGEYIMVCNNDITFCEGIDQILMEGYDGKIQSPLLVNVGDNRPLLYDHNINGTCWLIKRKDYIENIPEELKIWYNDNWLWNRYGNTWNHKCEVLHWGSQTVNSINHNPITSQDKEAFFFLCKERGWGKYYQTHVG